MIVASRMVGVARCESRTDAQLVLQFSGPVCLLCVRASSAYTTARNFPLLYHRCEVRWLGCHLVWCSAHDRCIVSRLLPLTLTLIYNCRWVIITRLKVDSLSVQAVT